MLQADSEASLRITYPLSPSHIALVSIEKVVPSRGDFAPFLELLPASATGQALTSYVSIIHPPLQALPFVAPGKRAKPREFHMVLIDNGRGLMREDPVLH